MPCNAPDMCVVFGVPRIREHVTRELARRTDGFLVPRGVGVYLAWNDGDRVDVGACGPL